MSQIELKLQYSRAGSLIDFSGILVELLVLLYFNQLCNCTNFCDYSRKASPACFKLLDTLRPGMLD